MPIYGLPRYPSVASSTQTERTIYIILFNGTEARLSYGVASAGQDELIAAAALAEGLWADADPVPINHWFQAVQVQYMPLYVQAQTVAWGVISSGGTLGASNAAAVAVFEINAGLLAQWNIYTGALEAAKGTALSALDVHHAIATFTTIGRQAAGN